MILIVGLIADKDVAPKYGLLDITPTAIDPPDLDSIKATWVINRGGAPEDYCIVLIDDPVAADRISNLRHSFNIVWTGEVITGFDFTPEDTKAWLRFSANKSWLIGDGVDTVDITSEVWKADKSGIATSVNQTVNIPIGCSSKGLMMFRFQYVNGVATKQLTFEKYETGRWEFPGTPYGVFNGSNIRRDPDNMLILQVVHP